MPTLIVEDVPAEVYQRLQERAAAERRSLPEEVLHLLKLLLRSDVTPTPRLPDFIPGDEIAAPGDLPRSSQPVPVSAYPGRPRLPDPLPGEASE